MAVLETKLIYGNFKGGVIMQERDGSMTEISEDTLKNLSVDENFKVVYIDDNHSANITADNDNCS